jgi:hypothetical protein
LDVSDLTCSSIGVGGAGGSDVRGIVGLVESETSRVPVGCGDNGVGPSRDFFPKLLSLEAMFVDDRLGSGERDCP